MPRRTRSRSSRKARKAPHDGLRRQGLRPIEIWVPDVRSLDFAAEAHRQSLAIAQSGQERRDQDFVDAISDFGEDGSVA